LIFFHTLHVGNQEVFGYSENLEPDGKKMGRGNSEQGLYYSVILKILTWDGYVVPTNAMGTKEYRWQQCFYK
jgi:hypothetical protein